MSVAVGHGIKRKDRIDLCGCVHLFEIACCSFVSVVCFLKFFRGTFFSKAWILPHCAAKAYEAEGGRKRKG